MSAGFLFLKHQKYESKQVLKLYSVINQDFNKLKTYHYAKTTSIFHCSSHGNHAVDVASTGNPNRV